MPGLSSQPVDESALRRAPRSALLGGAAARRALLVSAQREAVAVREEMLVGALGVSAGADGHQRYRIVTAVEQPLVGRPASLDLVRCERKASWVQLARSVGECGSLAAARA